ncbi:Nose resistant to fluoxetine protein 6 [Araneus ventricosus]|uniref:Nose resistant to fluoxetine protein 6 n=1 Tax=Araneus ventricosus TaxID=182803 RepID=A0A4Y2NPS0_ARAVE|nr:Nose resistant to fluoxetine protein 6 [Araneus ventricosus]
MHLNPVKLFSLLNLIIFNNFILGEAFADADSHDLRNFANLESRSAKYANIPNSVVFASEEDGLFLDEFQEFLGKHNYRILAYLLSQSATDKCFRDFKYIFESLPFAEWPVKMLDSFGKPESGILKGNVRWLGEFDECLEIYAPPKESSGVGDFRGKYCTLQMTVQARKMNLTLSMAVCLPDTCDSSEIIPDVTRYLNLTNIFPGFDDQISSALNSSKLTCQKSPENLTAGAIFVICLISIFVLLALIGSSITAYEYFIEAKTKNDLPSGVNSTETLSVGSNNSVASITENHHSLPMWLAKSRGFFSCFCLITNGERILNTDSAEGQLPCLHGIRFLSMSWVILCHAYATCFSAIRNPAEVTKFIDHWTFQIILNGFYSVDSFFLLSAFLVAHLFFKQCEKTNGKIPWLYFYIHRYIRLTPVYMIVVAFYSTLNKYLGSGPIWPDSAANTDPNCDVSLWRNLLYISNFNPDVQKCMAWTWYLANDMQFYIISPLFLVTLWRWAEYFTKFYIKPYTRLDPYLIGIALAYLLFRRKQSNAGKLNLMTLSGGWAIASGVTFTCLFGLYHQNPSTVASSFYNALNRTGFACGLAWVIFVCINDQGGVVNSILSWKLFIPLSRLTFCAYLLHPIIEIVYFSTVRRLIEFSHTILIIHYLGFLILSYAAAFVTSMLFESPVIRLERLIRNKFSS